MSVFIVMVNNSFLKSFNTIFIENEKNCQNINFFFPFPIKTFFRCIVNQCSKGIFQKKLMSYYGNKEQSL